MKAVIDYKRANATVFLQVRALVLLAAILPLATHAEVARLEAGFANPPREARPLGWWHWINGNVTKEGIKADLEAAKRAGMGGVQMFDVEIYMPPGPVRYGTDLWFEHVRYAIETAHELGLEFHLMNTPGWSASGGPWVTPELSMKELIWSETSTRGGEISLQTPRPESKSKASPRHPPRHPVDLEFYEDIAVIAVPRTTERIDEIERKMGAAAKPISRLPGADAPGIPADAVIDLTANMDDDGLLHATLPPGEWVILRFGYTTTGRGNHPAVPEGTGLEIDKLDAAAVAFQFQQAVGRILEEAGPLAGVTFNGLLFDSFEAGFQTWTKHLPTEFVARKGYDLLDWLPVLTGRIIESRERSEAVLWDFRHVIEELLAENYFGVMHSLAAKHGLKIYSESQGGPLNPLSANRHVDVPMNEFWMPDATPRAPLIKASVSAASLAGKRVVAAEAFTATPENGRYRNSLASLKRPGDQAFALGINRFALHSYTHQPVTEAAPGFALGRYGTHFGRLNTWWPYADGWIDYVSRSQFLLQQGRIVADVCFLVDEDLGYRIPSEAIAKLAGYGFELCYPPVVREMTVRDGVLSHPSGAMFRLLVTPDTSMAKTWVAELSTLRHLRDLVRAGAHLAGEPPVAPAGLNDVLHKDEFDRLVEEIWGGVGGNVFSKQLGKGRVHTGRSLLDILERLHVAPDLSWSPSDANIKFIHRRTANAEIYFVSSDAATPVRAELQFRQKDRRPEIWNALNGAHVNAPMFEHTDEGTSVPVQFGPQGAVFVVFRKPLPERWVSEISPTELQLQGRRWLTDAKSLSINYSNGDTERVTLGRLPASEAATGPWQVRFTDGRGAPAEAMFEDLTSWSEHSDSGIRYYSGTAIYETTFAAPPRQQGQVAMLDLGDVADVARVFVNGKEVGVLWTPPFRAEITPFLREGRNTLAVHVANRWVNRLIGDAAIDVDYTYQKPGTSKFTDGRIEELPEWLSSRISETSSARFTRRRHSFSVWKHYDADSPLVRSGLLGPVRIEWFWGLDSHR
jgi:hypothetical protein